MIASYTKQSLPDPENEGKKYINYHLVKNIEFCCEEFKGFCKKFTVWSYEQGQFTIIDEISYDGHHSRVINFCPFCGEKIEYKESK